MISFPHGKINLGLNVVARRSDGFHNIETCFYPIPLTDILEIIPSSEFSFSQSGIPLPGTPEENLCVKAYRLLASDFDMDQVKIHLHKVIPVGAGLGGGSSDAAITLRLLNAIFDLKISVPKLKDYAAQLGSDCSFFIEDIPMIGRGRGENLTPVSLPLNGLHVLLVKPDIYIATQEAYAGISPQQPPRTLEGILNLPVKEWRTELKNDFEDSIFKKFPEIGRIKDKMYSLGAIYASMSGSGSSVFGIFEKPTEVRKIFPGMFQGSGELK